MPTIASQPFQEALSFFKGKTSVGTSGWRDVMDAEHDHAFMVAGAQKADLLNDLRGAVDKAMQDGKSLEWFQKNFEEIVAKHGWEYKGDPAWRSRVILQTNISTSHAAGRFSQMTDPAILEMRPYWRWRHGDSVHPRPQHLAWDGMVLRADDGFWVTAYPPCGWGCQCQVFNLSEDDVKARGLNVLGRAPDPLAPTQPWESAPGIDQGFNYAPGATAVERMRPVIQEKLKEYPKPLADDLRRDMRKFLEEK